MKTLYNILIGFLLFFLLFYYLFAFALSVILEAENPTINPNHSYLLEAFPEEIPASAQNVQFFYSPGFLQKGMDTLLSYRDLELNKEEFEKRYKEKAIWIGFNSEYTEMNNLSSSYLFKEKLDHFKIYLIEGHCDDSGYCNHGSYLYVALDEDNQNVLYRYSQW